MRVGIVSDWPREGLQTIMLQRWIASSWPVAPKSSRLARGPAALTESPPFSSLTATVRTMTGTSLNGAR